MKIALTIPLLASTACCFTPLSSPSSRTGTCSIRHSTKLRLYNKAEEAIAEAERICAADPASQECRVAWDIVEELEAADSHQGGMASTRIDDSPDVSALMGSFDILLSKIDGKMNQLAATTENLAEMGARDPSIEELHQRAYEMKEAIAHARAFTNQRY